MSTNISNTYIIALGGSLVSPPAGPDVDFLVAFKNIIDSRIAAGDRFYIIVGGGHPARQYQDALRQLGANDKLLDHMGIFATHMNAYYVALTFGFPPEHKVVLKVEKLDSNTNLHISGAGLQPRQSSDAVAIQTAIKVGAKTIVNLSNVSQVYSADPRIDTDAKPIDRISWQEYIGIIPSDWRPGMSTPFDPVASRLASDHDLQVVVMGSDLKNLEHYMNGDEFIGSVLSNQ